MSYSSQSKGQMLIEVLIAIGIVAVTALIVAVALQAGPKTTETANARTRAFELAAEAQEIVRDIAAKNWNDVCDASYYTNCQLISGNPYYVNSTTTGWILVSGTSTISIGGTNYTRSVVFDNVSRASLTGAIEALYNPANDDPSTRKVTTTVSAPQLGDVSLVSYLTRWGKKDTGQTNTQNCAVFQTDWSGGVTTTSNAVTGSCLSASSLGTYLMAPSSTPAAAPPESSMEYTKVTGSLYMEPQP